MIRSLDAPLSALTTLRLGGPAQRVVEVDDADELVALVTELDALGEPVLPLGQGSNLVVADDGFDGTVVAVRTRGFVVERDPERDPGPTPPDAVVVRLAAGEPWDGVVGWAVAEGWSGVEALAGIPGLVGATPIQNVGAYGQELADVVSWVEALDRATGARRRLSAEECRFGYRSSRFKDRPGDFVVIEVGLRLDVSNLGAPIRYAELARAVGARVGDRAPAAEVRAAVLELRRRKGMVLDAADHDTWSAGSFFMNPVLAAEQAAGLPDEAPRYPAADGQVKTSAAWLIEHAGFPRGFGGEVGSGQVTLSTKHTLALTNRGGATTGDLLQLARTVRDGVRDRFGVTLVPEPTLLRCHL